ncbi:hypothetical protein TDB9533_04661 [Thalassocella blandensis]|nr:hypothetical protein TDB9533_04661 [Thalassocella blandensis]
MGVLGTKGDIDPGLVSSARNAAKEADEKASHNVSNQNSGSFSQKVDTSNKGFLEKVGCFPFFRKKNRENDMPVPRSVKKSERLKVKDLAGKASLKENEKLSPQSKKNKDNHAIVKMQSGSLEKISLASNQLTSKPLTLKKVYDSDKENWKSDLVPIKDSDGSFYQFQLLDEEGKTVGNYLNKGANKVVFEVNEGQHVLSIPIRLSEEGSRKLDEFNKEIETEAKTLLKIGQTYGLRVPEPFADPEADVNNVVFKCKINGDSVKALIMEKLPGVLMDNLRSTRNFALNEILDGGHTRDNIEVTLTDLDAIKKKLGELREDVNEKGAEVGAENASEKGEKIGTEKANEREWGDFQFFYDPNSGHVTIFDPMEKNTSGISAYDMVAQWIGDLNDAKENGGEISFKRKQEIISSTPKAVEAGKADEKFTKFVAPVVNVGKLKGEHDNSPIANLFKI